MQSHSNHSQSQANLYTQSDNQAELSAEERAFREKVNQVYKYLKIGLVATATFSPLFCPVLSYVALALISAIGILNYYDKTNDYKFSHSLVNAIKKLHEILFETKDAKLENTSDASNKLGNINSSHHKINLHKAAKIVKKLHLPEIPELNDVKINQQLVKLATNHAILFSPKTEKKVQHQLVNRLNRK